ncbi:MAG: AI-2E family transporter [Acidobacteriota bacterium]
MQNGAWKVLVGAAAAVIVFAGLRAASVVMIPVVAAGMLALVTYPLVAWLQRRGVPAALAVLITVIVALVTLAGPAAIIGTAATRFAARVPQYQASLQRVSLDVYAWLADQGLVTAGTPLANPAVILDWMTSALTGIVTLLSNLFLIVLLAAFMLLEAAEFRPKLRAAFGMSDGEVTRLTSGTEHVYQFLLLKTLVCVATGVAAGAWTALLGIEFAVLWGLVAFLLNYIPNFGSILAAIPPVLLALVQFGGGTAALVAVGYVALNLVLGSIVEPRLIGRRLGISPLALLVSLLFWGWLWGPVGLLLAVPITMAARIVLEGFPGAHWLAVLIARVPESAQDLAAQSAPPIIPSDSGHAGAEPSGS